MTTLTRERTQTEQFGGEIKLGISVSSLSEVYLTLKLKIDY